MIDYIANTLTIEQIYLLGSALYLVAISVAAFSVIGITAIVANRETARRNAQ